MPSLDDPGALLLSAAALLLGGVLKGATGVGAPVVGVPVLSLLYNVPFAVTVFVLPNLLSNLWQGWQFRADLAQPRFALVYAAAGGIGAGLGSFLLVRLPAAALMAGVACVVLLYIGFRLARPGWVMSARWAERLVVPVGFLGGALQGAGGVSAPVSVTFLNALQLERAVFIATISVFFIAMSSVQIPILWGLGLLEPQRLVQGLGVLGLILAGMPVGAWLAQRVSAAGFDRVMLALLGLIAVRLLWSALG